MFLVPFFLSNSDKKKPLGHYSGAWGGDGDAGSSQEGLFGTLPMVAVPPSLSLPSLPGPGQALPPRQFLPRLGAADNNEDLAVYLPASFRPQCLLASPRPQPAPGCSLW